MPVRPRTSVLICTFNRSTELECALASVSAQTDPDFEVVVVDDGSTDSTPSLLGRQDFAGRLRVLRNPNNLGIIASRNRGLAACRGRYISILDADDRLSVEKLEVHGNHLDAHPGTGVVWGQARLVGDAEDSALYPDNHYVFDWDLVSPYRVVHSATTWRRDALVEVGGYDESVFFSEGPDMFLKVGDTRSQDFLPGVVAEKHLQKGTLIRRFFDDNLSLVSSELMRRTLQRRYRTDAKALAAIPARIQALQKVWSQSRA